MSFGLLFRRVYAQTIGKVRHIRVLTVSFQDNFTIKSYQNNTGVNKQ